MSHRFGELAITLDIEVATTIDKSFARNIGKKSREVGNVDAQTLQLSHGVRKTPVAGAKHFDALRILFIRFEFTCR